MRVAFLHPDLGLGGAERLIVDGAVELQARGHDVTVCTTHHDRRGAFPETVDGTLDVRVYGAFLPHHVWQRLRAPSAIVRMAYLALAALGRARYDVVVCDLVPHVIPVVRAVTRAPASVFLLYVYVDLHFCRGGLRDDGRASWRASLPFRRGAGSPLCASRESPPSVLAVCEDFLPGEADGHRLAFCQK